MFYGLEEKNLWRGLLNSADLQHAQKVDKHIEGDLQVMDVQQKFWINITTCYLSTTQSPHV